MIVFNLEVYLSLGLKRGLIRSMTLKLVDVEIDILHEKRWNLMTYFLLSLNSWTFVCKLELLTTKQVKEDAH